LIKEKLLTEEKSIAKTIYIVALPTMIQMFLESSYNIVSTVWIGKLGSVALAGIAAASFIVWIILGLSILFEIGVNSLVAKSFGAKDFEFMKKVGTNGLRSGIIFTFLLMIVCIPFLTSIFKLMGLESNVINAANEYLIFIFFGLPAYLIMITNDSIFRGVGDTKTPLKILILSLTINLILTPMLMFGIWIFPELGIAGSALAAVTSHIVASIVSLILLKRRNLISTPSKKFIDFDIVKKIVKIGTPIAVNGTIFCIVYMFLTKIIAQFGTASIASLGIGQRVESIGYCLFVGFGIASTTLVAQNIGAGNYKKAKDTAWSIILYSGIVGFIFSIILILFSTQIARVFTTDPQVIESASKYLLIIGLSEIFMAWELVTEGIFSGIGNTLPTTIIGLPLNILRIPLAYILSEYMGINGVWIAVSSTTLLKGLLLILWLKFTKIEKDTSVKEKMKILIAS